jgi:hypothetical protein
VERAVPPQPFEAFGNCQSASDGDKPSGTSAGFYDALDLFSYVHRCLDDAMLG